MSGISEKNDARGVKLADLSDCAITVAFCLVELVTERLQEPFGQNITPSITKQVWSEVCIKCGTPALPDDHAAEGVGATAPHCNYKLERLLLKASSTHEDPGLTIQTVEKLSGWIPKAKVSQLCFVWW